MKRAMPEARFVDLSLSHPIFHSFFEIQIADIPQAYLAGRATFALDEDNDPPSLYASFVSVDLLSPCRTFPELRDPSVLIHDH